MKLTARAAAETISPAHNIGLRDAGRVLAAGLAGPATKQGTSLVAYRSSRNWLSADVPVRSNGRL
ncbi:hypothetical protein ABT304_12955 [Nocardioides sp. NPDC000445]|uniref:hypothetical protein n=1 Tax=Nocardioides sp. NPDC000445 TaxID=3154257 RepID=UPI003330EAC1